jgi:hypothetical protein
MRLRSQRPVIPVKRVVGKKRIIEKMEGQRGAEAQGVADQKNLAIMRFLIVTKFSYHVWCILCTWSLGASPTSLLILLINLVLPN